MADLTISQGDFGFNLFFTVQTATGGAFSLAGKTVTLKAWHTGRPSVLVVDGLCTVSTAALGTCSYEPASTDFMAKGSYILELECTEVGMKDSTKTYSLEVTESP
jgi:hypothetical protein